MASCREKHSSLKAHIRPCLVENRKCGAVGPRISALLWGAVSQQQPFCGLHPEPYYCTTNARPRLARSVSAEGGLQRNPRSQVECCCNHSDATRQSAFWRAYTKQMGELLPGRIAKQLRLLHRHAPRKMCCPKDENLEPGRRGRCLWKAASATCTGQFAKDCPVACGTCIVCADHPLHHGYVHFYRQVTAQRQSAQKMAIIEGLELNSSAACQA